jgi:hypothetical protein
MNMLHKAIFYFIGFILVAGINAHSYQPVRDSFAKHMTTTEQKHRIPKGLLSAISKVESGRYHKRHRKIISWPWVIHAEGEGQFFRTKQEAVAAVRALKAKGIKNIDVGLMQVNLLHHPQAFSSLDQAFDPQKNIEYAARFLTDLKKKHASWSNAIAHYHSALPQHHIPYRDKVDRMWREEKKKSAGNWVERDYFRFTDDTEDNPQFRAPKFRIIHVRSPDKSFSNRVVKQGSLHKISVKKRASQSPRFSKIKRNTPLKGSDRLQNHFRFIKPQKMRSFQLAQKTLKN